jgi:hypothetical protein
VALALLADATGFGRRAPTFALVILPTVLFIGVTTYGRLIQINRDEKQTVLAMNRLRNGYLSMRPYFTASPYDDERGFATSYVLVARLSLLCGCECPCLLDLTDFCVGGLSWARTHESSTTIV